MQIIFSVIKHSYKTHVLILIIIDNIIIEILHLLISINTSVIFESLLTAPRRQVFNPLKI